MEIFVQGMFGNPSNLLNFIKILNMFNRSLAFSLMMMEMDLKQQNSTNYLNKSTRVRQDKSLLNATTY